MIPSIRTADVTGAVDFYTDKLGFEVVRSSEGNVAVALGDERLMLEAAGAFYSPVADRDGNWLTFWSVAA